MTTHETKPGRQLLLFRSMITGHQLLACSLTATVCYSRVALIVQITREPEISREGRWGEVTQSHINTQLEKLPVSG